jgi:hypothetical protein
MKKRVGFDLDEDLYNEFKEKAVDRHMPLTVWVIQACIAYAKTADRYKKGKEWPVCGVCGKKHDEKSHYGGS